MIIPVYNVEEYLDECLTSVNDQSFADFEAILIDDGSTDRSAEIAQRWVERDPRFVLYSQANSGLGAARNAGFVRSSGRFITFLDSDDKTAPDAYRLMIETLDTTGSDFALGNVYNFDSQGRTWQSPTYKGVCNTTRLRTHITEDRLLIKDLLAHNKVWRREFWLRERLSFREGVLYEDLPTTIPAHLRARSVDVLSDVVDFYRWRDNGSSITQNRASDIRQFRDRITAVKYVSGVMGGWSDASLKEDYDVNALDRDIRYFVSVLPDVDESYRREALQLVRDFLDSVSPRAIDRVSVTNRLKYYLISHGRDEELLDYLKLLRTAEITQEPYTHRNGRIYLGSNLRDVPASVLDTHGKVSLRSRVSNFAFGADRLEISGWAYFERLPVATPDTIEVSVWLERTGRRVPMQVERVRTPEATREAVHSGINYDWSGFVATVRLADLYGIRSVRSFRSLRTLRSLRGLRRWRTGRWRVMVGVRVGDIRKVSKLGRPTYGAAERPGFVSVGRTQLRAFWDSKWRLVVDVTRRRSPVLVAVAPVGDQLAFDFTIARRSSRAAITVRPETGPAITARLLERDGGARVLVPLGEFESQRTSEEAVRTWRLMYRERSGRRPVPVLASTAMSGGGAYRSHRELWVRRTRYGTANLLDRPAHPRVVAAEWTSDGSLQLLIQWPDETDATQVVLAAKDGQTELRAPAVRRGSKLAATVTLDGKIDPHSSPWAVHLSTDSRLMPVEIDLSLLSRLPLVTRRGRLEYRFGDERWHYARVRISEI